MENFIDAAKNIAEDAVKYAAQNGITLDYTLESVKGVDALLCICNNNLDNYSGEEGETKLWNIAAIYGIYVGETMLRSGLAEKGFVWVMDEGMPVLTSEEKNITVSPITKAQKRIVNGMEDSLKSFADVVISIAEDGEMPKTGVLRVPDAETSGGKKIEKIVYKESDYFISLVAEGKEDFIIFNSHDGFFQFYGLDNQFVCEAWFNLNGKRAYIITNPDCKNTERIKFNTPYGEFTPRECDIISLEQLKTAVQEYFSNIKEEDFLAKVPHELMEI